MLVATGLAVHQFIVFSVSQRLDRRLAILADAAAHSLPDIKAQSMTLGIKTPPSTDNDGDLDIPWQNLFQPQQGLEWFDANGKRLGRAGKHLSNTPLVPKFHIENSQFMRVLTIPVHAPDKTLQGYVRVSESTVAITEEINRLQWGLASGGLVALILSGVGSWWLTKQSLLPIEQNFQKLEQFTADASHELRSPLTVIKTSVEVMESHPERVHPADVKKLQAIASATDQMTQLVEDLLWLARNDGYRRSRLTSVLSLPLDELLEEIIDIFIPQAQAKQITIKTNLAARSYVQGDPHQLKRLFTNLLGNALQYTPESGTVIVSATNSDKWVVVRVEDNGIGIAQEHLSLVFDRFWRADPARGKAKEGVGLGLAIALSIAQSHHGNITVTSQLGEGSCFQVCLPISWVNSTIIPIL
ncbi:MAG TPA: two-component sensor histidine kinase [Cyanobacteria bacterium UBA11149]|nr:two-component sensor histidine kinase [Cyanobacteria bacterium UBA11367]HBE60561.1 two-component sensor histidine kinase [Cyanobacteria bacterium UBA11366]HBK63791.1 two-component sensor histidine kinase [Cyanobacteria bacterium UBA11166]HBR72897.1 two-component sensor histidine kinase [Cyanobacteria bacterium UBA11159]HBS69010.1 two-component sensor histidine kinase [Cyanobacteria bacterium UBA11153]HBW89585.1 two-component sensor histidine kinase [Cyanobacteria bacterium UBA11149]HCA9340